MTSPEIATKTSAASALDSLLAAWPRAPRDQAQWLLRFGTAPFSGRPVRGNGIELAPQGGRADLARFLVWDDTEAPGHGIAYLAVLAFARGDWELVSLRAECPSCLGTGIVPEEPRPCDTCGATGWGASGVSIVNIPAGA